MIKIICVGKIKEKYLQQAISEYQKRLTKYTKLKIIEVADEGIAEKNKVLSIEENRINRFIDNKDYVIVMSIEGDQLNSVEFSNKLMSIYNNHSDICFIIGGSYGLSPNIKKRANFTLSFSKMTFPHQLFRIILLEQLYRSYKISNNESYHK